MKLINSLVAVIVLFLFSSCTKEKTTIIEPNGNSTTITKVGVDNNVLDSAKIKVNKGLEKTGDEIKAGAKELNEDIKAATSDAAEAVERSAKKVKEDTKK